MLSQGHSRQTQEETKGRGSWLPAGLLSPLEASLCSSVSFVPAIHNYQAVIKITWINRGAEAGTSPQSI